jgi:hypothetical protein
LSGFFVGEDVMLDKERFAWRGLKLHFGRQREPVLTLVADVTYPHLYRIQYPNGWMSSAANLTRAKDAAYGHARRLLVGLTPAEAPLAAEAT